MQCVPRAARRSRENPRTVPAGPRRMTGGTTMSSHLMQVFVATFDDERQAGDALKDFRAMDREGSIELIDAAVIIHKADGKVTFEETADPSGKKWAKRGAIAGGLVGLIFPPTIIASAVVGGVGGGIWG